MLRVLHFSDIHIQVPFGELPWKECLFNKRFVGATNLFLRRQFHFADAPNKMASLAQFAAEHRVELALCTGDFTALGTEVELIAARQVVEPFAALPQGMVAIAGNHDIYLWDGVHDKRFERHFGEFAVSEVPEAASSTTWPVVRFVGDDVAVIALKSAHPNPFVLRSGGVIPDDELAAFDRLLLDPRLAGRFIFVMTHHAPRRENGTFDRPLHGLVHHEAFTKSFGNVAFGAHLHGHIHWRYSFVDAPGRATFGCGSTTYKGREAFWIYDVDGNKCTATPGKWSGEKYVLEAEHAVSLTRA